MHIVHPHSSVSVYILVVASTTCLLPGTTTLIKLEHTSSKLLPLISHRKSWFHQKTQSGIFSVCGFLLIVPRQQFPAAIHR